VLGASFGLLSLALSITALSLTWGGAWADLWPTQERCCYGLVLLALLLPAAWLLAMGFERTTGSPTTMFRTQARGLIWLLVGVCTWLGFEWSVLDRWPLFTVPVWLLGMSLLVPLPLWLLPDRPGMTLARTLSHAAGAAWLLACHLPMVHGG
jgi:hypothetical protein